jgi:hypothetical protein
MHGRFKPRLVVHILAVVVAKRLLIEVTEEMERLNTHIGSIDAALEQTPEVLKAIGMNPPVDVLHGMVNNLMGIVAGKTFIGEKEVSIESRTSLDMLADLSLQDSLATGGNNAKANLPAALQDAHNGNLVLRSGSGDSPLLFGDVHVARFATDESLIRFDFAGEHTATVIMHGLADAVEHEPCRLLSDSKRTGDLAGANAVLAIAEHPESTHPLIETQRRILEDSADLKRELLLASLAEPHTPSGDEGMLLRPAPRAGNYTVRPAKVKRVLEATVRIAEVDDGVLECLGRVHVSKLRLQSLCVKYIFTLIVASSTLSERLGLP